MVGEPYHPDKPRRGPSPGLEAWLKLIIKFRNEWHKGDPPPKPGWRLLAGASWWLLALVAIIEKAVGG
jgi:hypothetical protein